MSEIDNYDFMMWFIGSNSHQEEIPRAVQYYQDKTGQIPTLAVVPDGVECPEAIPIGNGSTIQVITRKEVLKKHLWIGKKSE